MILMTVALLIIAVIAFVAYPVFQRVDELGVTFVGLEDSMWENLVTQRDAMYGAIKDIENEHRMGKLSDADYRTLRTKYETKAVAILHELDGLAATKISAHKSVGTDDDIEQQVVKLRQRKKDTSAFCPNCGTAHASDDVFCAKCGTSLEGIRCPTCGQRASPGDKFCGKCGATIQ